MRCRSLLVLLLALPAALVGAETPAPAGATRGELLYSTHCIACHSSQVHWRDKKLATDWRSLQREVRRWQDAGGLAWNNDDVVAVAAYLNARYYRYAPPD